MAIYKTSVAYLLSLLTVISPLPILAQETVTDSITTTGQESYSYGRNLIEGFNNTQPTIENGQMSIPSVTNGQFNNNSTVDLNELFPGISSPPYSPLELESVSSDEHNMNQLGENAQSQLWDDAHSASPTATGSAYRAMIDQSNQIKPDMSTDPSLAFTRQIFEDIDTISENFGDCEATTSFAPNTSLNHVSDLQQCNRVLDQSGTCDVTHAYNAEVIRHHSGPYNILPVDADSFYLWIGRIGDNYWRGRCRIYEQSTQVEVVNPQAITRVTLENVQWDDWIQIWIGELGEEQLLWAGPYGFPDSYTVYDYETGDSTTTRYPNGLFPPETPGRCELRTSWNRSPNLDITEAFLNNVEPGDVVRFLIRVSVSGSGEGYGRLRVDYDPALAIQDEEWTPPECINTAQGYYDGFASGTITCTDMPAETSPGSGCTYINGVTVCESHLGPSPFSEVSSLCRRTSLSISYDYYQGTFTSVDANGNPVTFEAGNGELNTCAQYESNEQCAFISQNCVDGAQAENGTCYVFDEVWDCGYDVQVNDIASETTYQCAGPIRCMGADCITPQAEQSSSFNETAALLNAVQFMGQDMNCVDPDGTQNVTCDIFGGEPHYCKIAVGGIQDCCDVPTNVSPGTYLQALMAFGKLDSVLTALDTSNPIAGAYQTLREPIANTVSTVAKPFASYAENIKGTVTEFFEPVQTFIDELKEQVRDAIVDTINDMIGDAAADIGTDAATAAATDQVAEAATESAGDAIVQNIGSAANFLMTAYTIYVVTVMVVQLIYECEEQEFELAAKNDVNSCQYVGSYCHDDTPFGCLEMRRSFCCYNSPLARIVSPQIKAQLGMNLGTARAPDCSGFSIDQVASVDWSQIDLSEWTSLLAQYDMLPDIDMTLDSLTGSQNDFQRLNDVSGEPDRLNVTDRAIRRMDDLDIDELRRDAYENTAVNPQGSGSQ